MLYRSDPIIRAMLAQMALEYFAERWVALLLGIGVHIGMKRG